MQCARTAHVDVVTPSRAERRNFREDARTYHSRAPSLVHARGRVSVSMTPPALPPPDEPVAFRTFCLFLLAFHLSEFALAFHYNPRELGWRSFLLSKPYAVAMGAAALEFHLEWRFFAERKEAAVATTFYAGVVMCLFGDWLRKVSICTAGTAFTHLIQTRRRPTHFLVTTGAYAYVRHPGYLGWFAWALGTQVMLGNPVCFVAFVVVTWLYFKRRITVEELYLRRMFSEYEDYARRVPTWIPGIK